MADILANAELIGEVRCPHPDGDFIISLQDLKNWSTGRVLIRQAGQCEEHVIVVNRQEARELAALLIKFADKRP